MSRISGEPPPPCMAGGSPPPCMVGKSPLHTQSSQHPDACRCHSASFHTRLHTLFSSHTHGSSHAHSSPCDVAHSQPRLLTHSALRSPFLPHSQLLHGASASRPTPVRSAEFKESRRASCRHTDSSEHCSLIAVDAVQSRGVLVNSLSQSTSAPSRKAVPSWPSTYASQYVT